MNPYHKCPWCGSPDTEAEYVDIGVGYQQVTPRVCSACNAQEFNYHVDDLTRATYDEKMKGWWKGDSDGRQQQDQTPECPKCAAAKSKAKEQEAAYRRAAEDFGRVAKGLMATRDQQERVVISLRNQLRDSTQEAVQQATRQLQDQYRALQQELTKIKEELAKEKAVNRSPLPEGADRFSLLEVD